MNVARPILDLLHDAQRKRDAAMERAERAKVEADKYAAEVEAYRRALEILGFEHDSATASSLSPPPVRRQLARRTPSQKWLDIYTALYLSSDAPYDYEAIMSAASNAQHNITDGAMRTQMMNAVKSGLFERVGPGQFKFTERGLEAIDARPDENEVSADTSEAKAGEGAILPGLHEPQQRRDRQ